MKKVLLITNYFHFAQEKSSNRYRQLAEMMAKSGAFDLEVITSMFYQRTKKMRKNLAELTRGLPYKVTFIEEPGYKKNISFSRLRTSQIFAKNVMLYIKKHVKPDLIYQVIPTLDVAYNVACYAKKNNIPLVIDIQDLWPEAFKMAFNMPILSDIVFYPFLKKANSIYSKADAICAVSDTYVKRALSVNTKVKKGHSVFIGIDLSTFDKFANRKGKKEGQRLKLAYCGSLEKSYDIKLVIDALKYVKDPPLFVVMGEGTLKDEFILYAKSKQVEVEFLGFLDYATMCEKLCECDITINPIIGDSVASIINKHGDYAASGLPVINTQNSVEYRNLIDQYQMGFNCKSGDICDVAEKISILVDNLKLREEMGKNARRCAEEKFDRNKTYKELVDTVCAFFEKESNM